MKMWLSWVLNSDLHDAKFYDFNSSKALRLFILFYTLYVLQDANIITQRDIITYVLRIKLFPQLYFFFKEMG